LERLTKDSADRNTLQNVASAVNRWPTKPSRKL
jgi:hypothetical protein